MPSPLRLVAFMGAISWLLMILAAQIRTKGWTLEGMKLAFGNRETQTRVSPATQRLERTTSNTFTNFVFFAAAVLVATAAGVPADKVALGANIFFLARLAYIPIYWAGIPYIRTVVYMISMVGLVIIVAPLF